MGRISGRHSATWIAAWAIFGTALFGLAGCSGGDPASSLAVPSQDISAAAVATGEVSATALDEYLTAMKALGPRETKLIKRYSSVTGKNAKSDATTVKALSRLVPDVQTFIGDLEGIVPPPGGIATAHETLLTAWNTEAEGITLLLSAIANQDMTLIAQGNSKMADARALMRKAKEQMTTAVRAARG